MVSARQALKEEIFYFKKDVLQRFKELEYVDNPEGCITDLTYYINSNTTRILEEVFRARVRELRGRNPSSKAA
jgi:hypothetical protein